MESKWALKSHNIIYLLSMHWAPIMWQEHNSDQDNDSLGLHEAAVSQNEADGEAINRQIK